MRLISLWEPWATLMAIGAKRIETRSWYTGYRGWLAIHASKGGLSKRNLAEALADPEIERALAGTALSQGRIVAVTYLMDCCPMADGGCLRGVFHDYPEMDTPQERAFGDFFEGRWAWVTEACTRLPQPIPFRAMQGLRVVPPEIVAQIQSQEIPLCR